MFIADVYSHISIESKSIEILHAEIKKYDIRRAASRHGFGVGMLRCIVRLYLSGEDVSAPELDGEELVFELGDVLGEFLLEGKALVDEAAGVEHGGMCAREACADCLEGHLGVLLGEIHDHLAGVGHLALARLGEELLDGDIVDRKSVV